MASDTQWTEYYLLKGYIRSGSRDIYAKDSFHNQKIFVNNKNEQVYARDVEEGSVIEFAPKNGNGEFIYIKDEHQRVRYPRNLSKPQPDLEYPVDQDQNPVYNYDSAGEPIFFERYGFSYYGKNSKGTEVYPKDKNGKEIYRKELGREIPAKTKDGRYYYAKNEKMDEYYPKMIRESPDQAYIWRDAYETDEDTGIALVK